MIFLDLDDLLHVATRTLSNVEIRDAGLLESAAARPRSTAFGDDAYPSIHDKAASLLHSIARNHPLVDGNRRLALAATIAFYGLNGVRLTLSNDEAYELVIAVAAGALDNVDSIARRLEPGRRTGPDTAHSPALPIASPLPAAAAPGQGWAEGPSRSDAQRPCADPGSRHAQATGSGEAHNLARHRSRDGK